MSDRELSSRPGRRARTADLPGCLTLCIRQLGRAEHVDLGAVIDVDCGADDSMTAYLRLPVLDIGALLRYLVTSWTSCYPTGDYASAPAPAIRAADERDWLLSSFIKGIKAPAARRSGGPAGAAGIALRERDVIAVPPGTTGRPVAVTRSGG